MKVHIKDKNLAEHGKKRIEWAERDMPVLRLVKERCEMNVYLAKDTWGFKDYIVADSFADVLKIFKTEKPGEELQLIEKLNIGKVLMQQQYNKTSEVQHENEQR